MFLVERSSRRSKNLENRENFVLENFHSLVCTNSSVFHRTEPCERSALTLLFCRPRNALAHIVALVAIQRIEIIGGREDGIVFDVFVVCRNIFHKTKYREKTFKSHACLIAIFFI
jgi:hypothetical protein